MYELLLRLKWALTADQDFLEQVRVRRVAREEAEREARKHHLNLCAKHQQEQNHSHYSEKNCDYCKLLKQLEGSK